MERSKSLEQQYIDLKKTFFYQNKFDNSYTGVIEELNAPFKYKKNPPKNFKL